MFFKALMVALISTRSIQIHLTLWDPANINWSQQNVLINH